jgi:exopolysaccharide biosynthesis polyprenyl glycosylphosphotransferase
VPRPLRTSERRAALLLGDTAALAAAVLLALWTWSLTAGFHFDLHFLRARAIWLASVPLWLLLLAPTRAGGIALDVEASARGIARAAGVLLLVYLAAFFFLGGAKLPRLIALYILWDATLWLIGWRLIAQWSFTRAPFSRRILVAGSGRALDVAIDLLKGPEFRDAEFVEVIGDRLPATGGRLPEEALPINSVVLRLNITDVIVAMQGDVDDEWVQQLLKCQERGTHVVRMTQLYEETLRRVPVGHLEPSWLLTNFFDVARARDTSPIAKRLFDLGVGALLGLAAVVLGPFIAIAVLLDGGGPVLYRQVRLGRGGQVFHITKFRSMRADAEEDGAARWSPPADPRVTRVGRVLRRTRLDELPNVIAILRGDMSVVGPRPERPEFVDQLEREVPFYRARLIVQPGLTGWAQVNLPYGGSVDDASAKLEYDLYYIKHQSIWFDAAIVLRTIGTLFRMAGR